MSRTGVRLVGALLEVVHCAGGREHNGCRVLQEARGRGGLRMSPKDLAELLFLYVLLCPVVALAVAHG